jgi:hypothetical protein
MKYARSIMRLLMVTITAVAVVGVLYYLLHPVSCGVAEMPPDGECDRRLDVIAQAIACYRNEEGPLPQVLAEPNGLNRSWRTLLAPYLSKGRSHNFDYRSDEPWNSPHNRLQFRTWVPCRYTCPLEANSADYPFASYVMLKRMKSSEREKDVRKDTQLADDAVLIVESADCQIEPGEPRDVDIESLFKGDSPFGIGRLNSLHPKVVKAMRTDGRVIDIPKDISKEDLRKLLQGGG